MLLKVGTQVSNALKITLTKFHQHLSTGSQVFEGGDKQTNKRRLTTRKEFSRLCYRPHREITRCGQKGLNLWAIILFSLHDIFSYL